MATSARSANADPKRTDVTTNLSSESVIPPIGSPPKRESLLRGKWYGHRANSYIEDKPPLNTLTSPVSMGKNITRIEPSQEKQIQGRQVSPLYDEEITVVSVSLLTHNSVGTQPVSNKLPSKDINCRLLNHLQLNNAIQSKKAVKRRSMNAVWHAQTSEKRRVFEKRRGIVMGQRSSLPTSVIQSPHRRREGSDLSPGVSTSTEESVNSGYPALRVTHTEPDKRTETDSSKKVREGSQIRAILKRNMFPEVFTCRRFPSHNRGSLHPPSDIDMHLNLDSAGFSQFVYPSLESEKEPSVDEIDRLMRGQRKKWVGREASGSPEGRLEQGSEAGTRGRRSFPRHVFKARNYWKSAHRPL